MTASPRYQRKPGLISTDMDGDTVMMSVERGEYYGLGGVGNQIWELLQQPHGAHELAGVLCQRFEVDEQRCLADVQGFIQQLLAMGLIHET